MHTDRSTLSTKNHWLAITNFPKLMLLRNKNQGRSEERTKINQKTVFLFFFLVYTFKYTYSIRSISVSFNRISLHLTPVTVIVTEQEMNMYLSKN